MQKWVRGGYKEQMSPSHKKRIKPLIENLLCQGADDDRSETYHLGFSTRDSSSRIPSSSNGSKDNNSRRSFENQRRNKPSDSVFPPYRIMVVDDEPDNVKVMKRGLQQQGFNVDAYTDPLEALSSFERHKYDIVLTDIRMPKMDGIKLYEHLRKVDEEVVICFFTAYEHFRRDFEIMHPEEPTNCFIQKPISIDRLVSTIIKKMDERENRWRRRL